METGGSAELTSAKTVQEFEDGTVTQLLNENGNYQIWLNGEFSPNFIGPAISIKLEGESVIIEAKTAVSGAKLFAASYDNGKLVDIKIMDIALEANSSDIKDISGLNKVSGGKVTVILLNDLNSIRPLTHITSKDY